MNRDLPGISYYEPGKTGASDTAGADGEDESESGQTVPVRLRTDD